jgi:hypothetical protein
MRKLRPGIQLGSALESLRRWGGRGGGTLRKENPQTHLGIHSRGDQAMASVGSPGEQSDNDICA